MTGTMANNFNNQTFIYTVLEKYFKCNNKNVIYKPSELINP